MRNVARIGDDPEPGLPSLEAEARQAIDEHRRFTAEAREMLRQLPAAACDQRLAALLIAQMQQNVLMGIDVAHHLEDARGEFARQCAVEAVAEHFFERGWDAREAAYQREAARAPRQGHRATRRPLLNVVRGFAPVAAILGVLHRLAGNGLAGKALAVHLAKVSAVGVASATAATGLTVVAAHVITSPSSPPGAWAGIPAPAASAFAAAPVSGPSMIGSVTRPKAATDASRWRQADSGPGLAPPYAPTSSSSSPSSAQPSQAPSQSSSSPQPQGGPAQLLVDTTAIDLTSGSSVVITVSAGGSGWASWSVNALDPATGTNPGDLDFSPDHGVLQAGQSVRVTVSVDPNQAVTGDLTEVFEIDGPQGAVIQQVTATLPAPVAAQPSPAVTGTDGATDVPSPDPASS